MNSTHPSGWWNYGSSGSGATGVTIINTTPACSGTCTSLTSSVTIPSGVTINAGVPLYEGFYQNGSNGAPAIYATVLSNPVAGSTYTYTISVPSGSGWQPFGILDENLDGAIDAGDVDTINETNNSNGFSVSGGTQTVAGVTMPSAGATALVETQYYNQTYNGGTNIGYNLYMEADVGNLQPVAVELESGPNFLVPNDLSNYCGGCGHERWSISSQMYGVTPNVGDTYTFKVWYLGNSTPSTITASVVGWNGGSSLTGAGDTATLNSPYQTSGTQPNFSWSLPSTVTSDDLQQFQLYDDGTSGNSTSTIWQIPSSYSNSNGLSTSYTSLTWDQDPTDGTNTSSESTLSPSNIYGWQIQVNDSNGNEASKQTWFKP